MKKSRSAFLLLLVPLLLSAGCGRMQAARQTEDSTYAISLAVQPNPPVAGPAQLTVAVADRQGNPVALSHIRVQGDMTHAGMAPVVVESAGQANDRTQLAFNWTMDGDWVVDVRVTLADGRTIGKQFPMRVGK